MKHYITHQVTGQILRVKKAPNMDRFFVTIGRTMRESPSEGQPLPHIPTPRRTSRYVPHVGAKQKLKQTRRMLRDPKASLALNA